VPKSKKIRVVAAASSNLEKLNSSTGLWGRRFPTSFVDAALNQNPSPSYGGNTSSSSGMLRDPYNQTSKNRFEDTLRADKIVQLSLIKKIMFILSKKPTISLDVGDDYPTKELQTQALETIASQKEYKDLMRDIRKINRDVKFHYRMIAAELQKRTFGRSALGIVFKESMPSELKVFASKNLGQVYIDPATWRFEGVDYHDNLIKKQQFDASELLYFTHLDFNITPDTLYYGLSELEGVAHDSETNRIISEEDNKEIAKSNWAPKFLLPVPGVNDPNSMDEIVNALDPSRPNVINADVGQPVVLDSKGSGSEVNAIREANDQRMIRELDLPQPMMGYENNPNRATMDTVMQVYHATTIDFERLMITSQIEPQWYDSLTVKLLSLKNIDEAKARVCMEFEDLVFETASDQKDVLFGLLDRGLITPARILKQFGYEDAVPELEEAQRLKMEQKQMEASIQSAQALDAKAEHKKRMELHELAKKKLEEMR
jgi:hypothetical protein